MGSIFGHAAILMIILMPPIIIIIVIIMGHHMITMIPKWRTVITITISAASALVSAAPVSSLQTNDNADGDYGDVDDADVDVDDADDDVDGGHGDDDADDVDGGDDDDQTGISACSLHRSLLTAISQHC